MGIDVSNVHICEAAINNSGSAKARDQGTFMVIPNILKIKETAGDLAGNLRIDRFCFLRNHHCSICTQSVRRMSAITDLIVKRPPFLFK